MITCSCGGVGCKLCAGKQAPKVFLPIEPMGAVRTTQRAAGRTDKGQKYVAYKEHLRLLVNNRVNFIEAGNAVVITDLKFYMPMNANKKTAMMRNGKRVQVPQIEGQPHIKKPDIDNLVKGFFDAMNGFCWADDAQVYKVTSVEKVYSDMPGIEFGIEFMEL